MKKIGEILFVICFIMATVGVVIGMLAYEHHLAKVRNVNTIELETRAVSTYSKTEIRVKKGQHVRIRIRNVDNVSHGFAIPELDVEEHIIRAGQVDVVEFVPKFTGEFVYQCVVQCSMDKHQFMRGKLVVEP